MAFKEWLIMRLGGYTNKEVKGIKDGYEERIERLKVALSEAIVPRPQVITKIAYPSVTLTAASILTEADDNLGLLPQIKENVASQLADALLAHKLIKFDIDYDTYSSTTNSRIVKGESKVVNLNEDSLSN